MKPPPPIFLPALLQDRILTIWSGLIQQAGVDLAAMPEPVGGEVAESEADGEEERKEKYTVDRETYVNFRALVEAYRMTMAGPMIAPPPNAAMLPSVDGGAGAPPAASAPANGGGGGRPQPTASTAPMPEGGKN